MVRYTFTVRLLHSLHPARYGAFGTGLALRHVTPSWVLHSNLGCCIGTIEKSAAYKICGAAERRAVPIRELVENKDWQLKKKSPRRTSVSRLLSRCASWRLILEQLAQSVFELLLDLGFVNGVFMPDSQDRFFAELLRVVNTANDELQRL